MRSFSSLVSRYGDSLISENAPNSPSCLAPTNLKKDLNIIMIA